MEQTDMTRQKSVVIKKERKQKKTMDNEIMLKSEKLNDTIRKLKSNGMLTDTEKNHAIEIISIWEKDVIQKLKDRLYETESIIQFIETKDKHVQIDKAIIQKLTETAGLEMIYKRYSYIINQITLPDSTKPDQPEHDPNKSVADAMKEEQNHKLNMTLHNLHKQHLEQRAGNIMGCLRKELNKNEEIKELLVKMKTYRKNASGFITECKQKAQLAKINISIESETIRNALTELITFAEKI